MNEHSIERNRERRSYVADCALLFSVFGRIGFYMIGGGYVMLPLLQRDLVNNRGWLTESEMLNCFALGQSAPGAIAVNTAVLVGYKRRGFGGALAAVTGVVAPSLLIIMLIAALFPALYGLGAVQVGMKGVRVAVAALLVFTVAGLARRSLAGRFGAALALGAFTALLLGASPVLVVLSAAVLGWLRGSIRRRRQAPC